MLLPTNATCLPFPADYCRLEATLPSGDSQEFAVVASPFLAMTDAGGGYPGALHPVYTDAVNALVAACEKSTNSSVSLICSNNQQAERNNIPKCPPPMPCEFNSGNAAPVGGPVAAGSGEVQLLHVLGSAPLELTTNPTFAACLAQGLPSAVSQAMKTSLPNYETGHTSAGQGRPATKTYISALVIGALLILSKA